jgi:hypothetical protein
MNERRDFLWSGETKSERRYSFSFAVGSFLSHMHCRFTHDNCEKRVCMYSFYGSISHKSLALKEYYILLVSKSDPDRLLDWRLRGSDLQSRLSTERASNDFSADDE